jgi:4-amino-4-deoxy-L-arabinose transferase-like glycosyltransferase
MGTRALWAILAVALAIRVAAVGGVDIALRNDPSEYDTYALSISRGDGYPDTYAAGGGPSALRPPAYPHFLAGVYVVAGHRVKAARLAQALLGTAVVALIALLAWRLWDRRVALIAAALAAVYPPLIIVGTSLLSEALFIPLALGALAAAVEYRRSGARGWVIAAGLLAGVAALTRANGVVLLLPLAIAVWPRGRTSWRALAAPAGVIGLAAVVIAPWTIRNAIVMDAFIPVSSQTGYTMAGQYNPVSRSERAKWIAPQLLPGFRPWFADPRLDEVALDAKLKSAAVREIRRRPLHVVQAAFWDTARWTHLVDRRGAYFDAGGVGVNRRVADAGVIGFWIVAALALAGLATGAARRAPFFFWFAPLVVWAGTVWLDDFVRVRTPIDPFLIVLAALALAAATRRWSAAH